MPVDNEAISEHTIQDIEVTLAYDTGDGLRNNELGIMGFTLKEAVNVAQWLSKARGDDIVAIKSI